VSDGERLPVAHASASFRAARAAPSCSTRRTRSPRVATSRVRRTPRRYWWVGDADAANETG
jgi:hypothetical protein